MPPKRKELGDSALDIEPIKEPPGAKHPDPPHPNLPAHEFSCLLVAPRGSGKTTLVLNLLQKMYKGFFHRIIVFSPTMKGDTKWESVRKQKGILAKYEDPLEDGGEHKDKKHRDEESESESDSGGNTRNDGHAPSLYASSWHSLFAKVTPGPMPALMPESALHLKELAKKGAAKSGRDGKKKFTGKLEKKDLIVDVFEEDLQKVMTESMDHIDKLRRKGHPKQKAKRTMIVFDDLVGSHLFGNQRENAFRRLNATQRHYSISTLMCVQSYKDIPKLVRVNATIVILFEINNQKELEVIFEECSVGMTKEEWMSVYNYCTAEPFGFMMLNWQKPKGERVWKGLGEMVATPAREDVKRLELQKQVLKEAPQNFSEEKKDE